MNPHLQRTRRHAQNAAAILNRRAGPTLDRLAAAVAGQTPATTKTQGPNSGGGWGWPGIYLGARPVKGGDPVWSGPERHVLVVGPPRSGKTSAVVIPTIALHPGPIVATSTKYDLLAATAWRRSHVGRCWLWDPANIRRAPDGITPLRWSPLQGCHEWDAAVARAWALATAARPWQHHSDAAHWIERAQALLAPLLHAAALAESDLGVLLDWLHRRQLDRPLDILARHRSGIAHGLLCGIEATDNRELSGIYSTADSLLAAYRTDAALDAARAPNFDPDAFAGSGDTVYLCAPGDTQAQYAPLIVALLHHIRRAILRRRRPWPPMIWCLDEVANIAPLPDLPNIVADSAAQGLLILACLQDLSQARARWGPAADGFLTLFADKIILPGVADLATLQTISAMAGETEIRRTTQTVPIPLLFGGGHASRATHWERRPLLPPGVIAQGRPGHALLLAGAHPATLALTPWYDTPALRQHLQPQ
ncbi:MAG: type IV secretory system conjugative DNA transfer family protein [Acidimicrobiales bacterium]